MVGLYHQAEVESAGQPRFWLGFPSNPGLGQNGLTVTMDGDNLEAHESEGQTQ